MANFTFSKLRRNNANVFLTLVVLLLTIISFRYFVNTEIYKNVEERIEVQHSILTGHSIQPYQYRILKPALGEAVQTILSPFIKNPAQRHLVSYEILLFVTFLGIFGIVGIYLQKLYSTNAALIGILLLQTLFPLSITSIWQEGDFYNLLFFSAGIYLFYKNKDIWLPLIFLVGSFNREQIIFLNVFYAIYLYSQKKLFVKRSILILAANTFIAAAVYFALRLYFGFMPTQFVAAHTGIAAVSDEILDRLTGVISHNTIGLATIARFWAEMFALFIILCIVVFKKSSLYFKLSFVSLGIYTLLFFLMGFMTELAKFLPAALIMIPMCLKFQDGYSNEMKNNDACILNKRKSIMKNGLIIKNCPILDNSLIVDNNHAIHHIVKM